MSGGKQKHLARHSSLALFNSLDQEQLSRHFTRFCGLAGRFLIVNIWVYNVSAPRDSVKCTGPGFYLQAIGLIFFKKKIFCCFSLVACISIMEESSPACGDFGLSHFIFNMIHHALALHFIYAHYCLHPKVENTSFN